MQQDQIRWFTFSLRLHCPLQAALNNCRNAPGSTHVLILCCLFKMTAALCSRACRPIC